MRNYYRANYSRNFAKNSLSRVYDQYGKLVDTTQTTTADYILGQRGLKGIKDGGCAPAGAPAGDKNFLRKGWDAYKGAFVGPDANWKTRTLAGLGTAAVAGAAGYGAYKGINALRHRNDPVEDEMENEEMAEEMAAYFSRRRNFDFLNGNTSNGEEDLAKYYADYDAWEAEQLAAVSKAAEEAAANGPQAVQQQIKETVANVENLSKEAMANGDVKTAAAASQTSEALKKASNDPSFWQRVKDFGGNWIDALKGKGEWMQGDHATRNRILAYAVPAAALLGVGGAAAYGIHRHNQNKALEAQLNANDDEAMAGADQAEEMAAYFSRRYGY